MTVAAAVTYFPYYLITDGDDEEWLHMPLTPLSSRERPPSLPHRLSPLYRPSLPLDKDLC